jgi:uncharacterized protein (DUF433 family)
MRCKLPRGWLAAAFLKQAPLTRQGSSAPPHALPRRIDGTCRPQAACRGSVSCRPPPLAMVMKVLVTFEDSFERNPKIAEGQPVLRGTLVPLRTVLASLAEGASLKEILKNFPTLTTEHLRSRRVRGIICAGLCPCPPRRRCDASQARRKSSDNPRRGPRRTGARRRHGDERGAGWARGSSSDRGLGRQAASEAPRGGPREVVRFELPQRPPAG